VQSIRAEKKINFLRMRCRAAFGNR